MWGRMKKTRWRFCLPVIAFFIALFLGCRLLQSSELFLQRDDGKDEAFYDLVDIIAAMGREQPPLRRERLAEAFVRELQPWLTAWRDVQSASVSSPPVLAALVRFRQTVRQRTHAICVAADDVIDDVIVPNVMDDETKIYFKLFQADLLSACVEAVGAHERWRLLRRAHKAYRVAWGLAHRSLDASHPLRLMLAPQEDDDDTVQR